MKDIAEKVRRKVDKEVVSSQLSPVRAIALYTREVFKCKVFWIHTIIFFYLYQVYQFFTLRNRFLRNKKDYI